MSDKSHGFGARDWRHISLAFGAVALIFSGAVLPKVFWGSKEHHAGAAVVEKAPEKGNQPAVVKKAEVKVAAVAAPVVIAQSSTNMLTSKPLGLGRPATADEIAAWDIDIRPDGKGLPTGSGSVAAGEGIFVEQCAACHGEFGEAVGRWPVLAGGAGTLSSDRPVKTIGSYWPYASTIWDYIHRAMPFGAAQTLSDDEVYSVTAYVLYLNDLVDEDFVLSNENFSTLKLPNEANFMNDNRLQQNFAKPHEPCMKDCKGSVKVMSRARDLDVTPFDSRRLIPPKAPIPTEWNLKSGAGTTSKPAQPAAGAPKAEAPKPDAPKAEAPKPKAPKVAAAPAAKEEDTGELVEAGKKVFRKCKACHQVGDGAKNRSGPVLNGIVGRKIGVYEGFRFSNALKGMGEEGKVWDEANLDAFLTKPRSWAKGTKMSFSGLRKEKDRKSLIEFLKTQKE